MAIRRLNQWAVNSLYRWKARRINWVRTESTKEGIFRVTQVEIKFSQDIFSNIACPSFLVLCYSFPDSSLYNHINRGTLLPPLSKVLLFSPTLAIFFPVIFRHWPSIHHEDFYLSSNHSIFGFPAPGSATRWSRWVAADIHVLFGGGGVQLQKECGCGRSVSMFCMP